MKTNNREEIAKQLVWLRNNEGWTQQDVADKLDISEANYRRIEGMKFSVPLDTLTQIARLYGYKVALVRDTDGTSDTGEL